MRTRLHASAVAFCPDPEKRPSDWIGLLILGRSGAGKSELALELMGQGARLVADDQTDLQRIGGSVWLSAPDAIRGMIELRGMGILRTDALERAPLAVIVDLDVTETERLPPLRNKTVLDLSFPLLSNAPGRAFAIGLKHYMLALHWCDEDGTNAHAPERP